LWVSDNWQLWRANLSLPYGLEGGWGPPNNEKK
jgi:hypothetical protein